MILGADTDEMREVQNDCTEAAKVADQVVVFLTALVAVLKAASLWTGGSSAAYAAYLEGTVIPWLKKISMALKAFAQVLGSNAQAQDEISAGGSVDLTTLPRYTSPQLPSASCTDSPSMAGPPAGAGAPAAPVTDPTAGGTRTVDGATTAGGTTTPASTTGGSMLPAGGGSGTGSAGSATSPGTYSGGAGGALGSGATGGASGAGSTPGAGATLGEGSTTGAALGSGTAGGASTAGGAGADTSTYDGGQVAPGGGDTTGATTTTGSGDGPGAGTYAAAGTAGALGVGGAAALAGRGTGTGLTSPTGFDYRRIEGVRDNPNVTPEFLRRTEQIATRLGCKPEDLMAVMSFETGGTFSPSQRNLAGGSARGLIQFMPDTARGLGTSSEALVRMTPVQQLDYVDRYFGNGRYTTVEGLYSKVLAGRAVNDPEGVLFREGTRQYRANRGVDIDGNGLITAGEAATKVRDRILPAR